MDGQTHVIIHNSWFQVGHLHSSTRSLDMIEAVNRTLCFLKAVATTKTFPAIIMSNEEYFESYVTKFLGTHKHFQVNILRKAEHVLMESYSGFGLRRFEVFEEDFQQAIEVIMASGIPHLFLYKPLYADKLNLNPNSKGLTSYF